MNVLPTTSLRHLHQIFMRWGAEASLRKRRTACLAQQPSGEDFWGFLPNRDLLGRREDTLMASMVLIFQQLQRELAIILSTYCAGY